MRKKHKDDVFKRSRLMESIPWMLRSHLQWEKYLGRKRVVESNTVWEIPQIKCKIDPIPEIKGMTTLPENRRIRKA